MGDCKHMRFHAQVDVARIAEEGDEHASAFRADVAIRCADCGEAFVFMGMPRGLLPIQPTMSADRTEARLPIAPQGEFALLSTHQPGRA